MYSAPSFYYVYIMTNRSKTPTQASPGIWNNVCSNTIKASRVNSRRAQDRPSCLLRAFRGSTLGDWRVAPASTHYFRGGFYPSQIPGTVAPANDRDTFPGILAAIRWIWICTYVSAADDDLPKPPTPHLQTTHTPVSGYRRGPSNTAFTLCRGITSSPILHNPDNTSSTLASLQPNFSNRTRRTST